MTSPAPRRRRAAAATALTTALVLGASACGGAGSDPATAAGEGPAEDSTLSVVASTDVYGDIARAIAGERAEVVSIIDDPAQDPHSYEASTRDQLAVKRADVVIANGGGYDPYMDAMLDAVGRDGRTVITAVDLFDGGEHAGGEHAAEGHAGGEHAGDEHAEETADAAAEDEHGHGHGGVNEHVWYDLDTAQHVAEELVGALSAASPEDAATFEANGEAFAERIAGLLARQEELRATTQGKGVAVTEPLPVHMLAALDMVDRTPAEFSESMEEGSDVSPAVLQETLTVLGSGQVAVLVYNEQTSGAQTEQVEEAAREAGVPVVPVTETLPDGKDYATWMSDTLTALEEALTP
ncbi:zinc/manganese transport system substrate-binding protein [Kineococcus xinjiangensis]|uniref:Zinc/manganese transport system substrate-binding protein n=1 Tax=Kineococcus xinjiangensis TaxID=512762 RepID=A0A2S6IG78_9ACTN|nr:zinc ABC transporter substrate-binding protein [Kineococcus xinjiangensis]PPK93196.1 zinc/manganese transport system substrate-binding protein [Kineococcus xinjiangensis]